MDQLPEQNFDELEINGIQALATKVMSRFTTLGTEFGSDMTKMYRIFNYVHPKDGLLDKNNLLTGM